MRVGEAMKFLLENYRAGDGVTTLGKLRTAVLQMRVEGKECVLSEELEEQLAGAMPDETVVLVRETETGAAMRMGGGA
jgi:hypothetical protein